MLDSSVDNPVPSAAGQDQVIPAITADAEVVAASGWQRAEWLRAGDEVLTFHRGMQPLRQTSEEGAGPDAAPLVIPAGAIGNTDRFTVTTGDIVAFESTLCQIMHDAPFVLMPAGALVGFRGIVRDDATQVRRLRLRFDRAELVLLRAGAMLLCGDPDEVWSMAEDLTAEGDLAILDLAEAKRLLALADAVEADMARFLPPI